MRDRVNNGTMSRRNLIVEDNIILPFAKGAAKWLGTDGKTGQEQNTAARIESAAPLKHDTGHRHSIVEQDHRKEVSFVVPADLQGCPRDPTADPMGYYSEIPQCPIAVERESQPVQWDEGSTWLHPTVHW